MVREVRRRSSQSDRTLRILIDPGHGGKSEGTLQGFIPEKDINLAVGKRLADRLKDWDVHLTRDTDVYLSLADRVDMTLKVRPDVFLSIHHNAYEEEVECRSELYTGWYTVSPSYDLAYLIYAELEKKLPHRRWIPPLPSTYTVVSEGPNVRLLTELFFAREMDENLIDVEVDVLYRALEAFRKLPDVKNPDPLWSYDRWTYLPGHRTTEKTVSIHEGGRGESVIVLRDGRAFWYGLHLSRILKARYIHTGMTAQMDDLHVALSLAGHRGITLILEYGEPEIRYYHSSKESEALAHVLKEALGCPVREGSSYLLIHLYGPRLLIRSKWGEGAIKAIYNALSFFSASFKKSSG